ncbi:MAG: superinfection exclusion B family protein [Veillonella sp. oral taxon 780]|jgi:hypothetical protein|nr:superinfection exclusion B family protein [Veillonella sp. oral taxon 780]
MNFNISLEDLFKLPKWIIYIICASSGTLLFLPDEMLQKIYLFNIREEYGYILGLIFIVSLLSGIGLILNNFYEKIKPLYNIYCKGKYAILSLSTYEKAILFMMYTSENYTLKLKLGDGAVVRLKSENIITVISGYYFADASGTEMLLVPHVLQSWVIKLINNNSKVLRNLEESFFEKEHKIHNIIEE